MSKPKDQKLPEIHFDLRSGAYWLRNGGRYLKLADSDVKIHFMHAGFFWSQEDEDTGMKAGERVLVKAQLDKWVDYAGPLAGHKQGVFQTPGGSRILVTEAPRFEFPRTKGDEEWPFIEKFLFTLLGDEQAKRFMLWLKFSRLSLATGDFRPGQLVVLAGPARCGKSFLQWLVTQALGGRCAAPYRYMVGETSFNADLATAEHLAIEDVAASTDIRARRKFGAAIKEFTVCAELSVHGKGKQAITLPTFRRLTLSVNEEAENLMIVPPMDASLADKVMLFKCQDATAVLSEERRDNAKRVMDDMPAFCAALAKLPCPPRLRCPRFGVVAYHHPELVQLLTASEPHLQLLELVDQIIFKKSEEPWTGSAHDLELELRESSFNFAVDRLLYFSGACGTYLGRLKSKSNGRVNGMQSNGKTRWAITAPNRVDDTLPLPLK